MDIRRQLPNEKVLREVEVLEVGAAVETSREAARDFIVREVEVSEAGEVAEEGWDGFSDVYIGERHGSDRAIAAADSWPVAVGGGDVPRAQRRSVAPMTSYVEEDEPLLVIAVGYGGFGDEEEGKP